MCGGIPCRTAAEIHPARFPADFITDAVLHGMPPHIAQLVAGHRDINTTMGYKAVYPEEAINGHRAFIAPPGAAPGRGIPDPHRRGMAGVPRPLRAPKGLPRHLRPLLRHRLHPRALLPALPPLRPDPAQRQRLLDVRDNLLARIEEARREGWLGEVEGLQISLAGARTKLAQVEQMTSTSPRQPVQLGIPTRTHP